MSDERCNPDLGPLTAKLLEQQREIARLTAERDEARRFACENTIHPLRMPIGMTAREYAEVLGWDCFKEARK